MGANHVGGLMREIEQTAVTEEITVEDESPSVAIPAQAGIEVFQDFLDPGVRRGELGSSLRSAGMLETRR